MPWTGDPYQLLTLDELGESLRRDRPKAGDDPRLAELNEAARRLLQIASKLHEHGFRLGLLQPRTILLVPGISGRDLVLPDYGFVWKNAPFKPAWIESDTFKPLWDEKPEQQQHVEPATARGPLAPEGVAADIRTVARLFACVLTGVPSREVPKDPPAMTWTLLTWLTNGRMANRS